MITILCILSYFSLNILFAILCHKLAAFKGYTGYGATGFFFGLFWLIYVGFLPNKNEKTKLDALLRIANSMALLLVSSQQQRSEPNPTQEPSTPKIELRDDYIPKASEFPNDRANAVVYCPKCGSCQKGERPYCSNCGASLF